VASGEKTTLPTERPGMEMMAGAKISGVSSGNFNPK
jgi:hypothetical protein